MRKKIAVTLSIITSSREFGLCCMPLTGATMAVTRKIAAITCPDIVAIAGLAGADRGPHSWRV